MSIKAAGAGKANVLVGLIVLIGLTVIGIIGLTVYSGIQTIDELLTQNKKLKESLTLLTQEDQIGYAKVVRQDIQNGKMRTTLKFVETARGDKLHKILEKEYTIQGDVVYFDALIVKFSSQLVLDGQERSLYLWRRVYGENRPPSAGYAIEAVGKEPRRYAGLLKRLRLRDRDTFWSAIWDLANDPQKLKKFGVQAIYGNVVYSQLKAGLIYVFKISNSGQVYPETVPEM